MYKDGVFCAFCEEYFCECERWDHEEEMFNAYMHGEW
jgi:hypothetical protein